MSKAKINSPRKCYGPLATVQDLLILSEMAFLHRKKRENPSITKRELQAALHEWYRDRPGARFGDGCGVLRKRGW